MEATSTKTVTYTIMHVNCRAGDPKPDLSLPERLIGPCGLEEEKANGRFEGKYQVIARDEKGDNKLA